MGWFKDFIGPAISIGTSAWGAHENSRNTRQTNETNYNIAQANNAANLNIAQMNNASNAEQVAKLMQWQTTMSGTQYRRQMADMKAAGINPMLAANMGGSGTPPGASIPSQVGAPMQGATMQSPGGGAASGLAAGISSAMDAIRLKADMKNLAATNDQIKSSTAKNQSDTILNKALTFSAAEDANLKSSNAKIAKINEMILRSALAGSKVEKEIDETSYGKFFRYMGRMNPLSSATGSAKNIASILK